MTITARLRGLACLERGQEMRREKEMEEKQEMFVCIYSNDEEKER